MSRAASGGEMNESVKAAEWVYPKTHRLNRVVKDLGNNHVRVLWCNGKRHHEETAYGGFREVDYCDCKNIVEVSDE